MNVFAVSEVVVARTYLPLFKLIPPGRRICVHPVHPPRAPSNDAMAFAVVDVAMLKPLMLAGMVVVAERVMFNWREDADDDAIVIKFESRYALPFKEKGFDGVVVLMPKLPVLLIVILSLPPVCTLISSAALK